MHRLTCVVVLSILIPAAPLAVAHAGASPLAAQQAPQRDKPVARTGTAAIKGRVLTADTGTPLRRAHVSLDSGNPLESRGTTADLDGWFEFTDLAAGSYRVSASKGNYVTLEYGQRRAFQRGTPIELTDGQVADRIQIVLPRGAVLSGVLRDDVGDPATGVRVTAMRPQYRDGRRALVPVGTAVDTNDRGEYRLYGLPPGSYFVSALPSRPNLAIPLLSAPTGAPTYYPGTINEAEAERVSVTIAEERALADLTLVPSRLVKITGTATNSSGGPAQTVMLVSAAQMSSPTSPPGMTMGVVRPDGSFQLTNVAPGEYAIMSMSNAGTADQEIVAMPLTVAGEDITGVVVQTTTGYRATGQILFDPGPVPPGLTPAKLMLVAAPASPTSMSGTIGRGTINEDWTFEIRGLAGPRRFQFGPGLPAGWMIQSVYSGATDITDQPLDVSGEIDGVVITLTSRGASLSGSVTDDRSTPIADCTVVIFPDDTTLGPPASTRFLRAVRPNAAGQFRAERLPAATYLVVAVDALEPGDEHDPALLEQLRASATRVALGWGDSRDVPLQLKPIYLR
jgi:hypothetical protein